MLREEFEYIFGSAKYFIRIYNKRNMRSIRMSLKENIVSISSFGYVSKKKIEEMLNNFLPKLINKTSEKFRLWGKEFDIDYKPSNKFSYVVDDNLGIIHLYGKPNAQLLKMVLSDQIYLYIERNKNRYVERLKLLNIPFIKPVVKNYKGVHGKYTTKENIFVSSHLGLLDSKYLDYVIYHEHAHYLELNHGNKFHSYLEILCPNHQKLKKELGKEKININYDTLY